MSRTPYLPRGTSASVVAVHLEEAKEIRDEKKKFGDRANTAFRRVRNYAEANTHIIKGRGVKVVLEEKEYPLPANVVLFIQRLDGKWEKVLALGPCVEAAGGMLAFQKVSACYNRPARGFVTISFIPIVI